VPTLSPRAVNRATLDRQLLLRRHPLSARQAVRQLAGMQAQAPLAPYVGLWTRLSDFDPAQISTRLLERTVVRAPLMRGTVHLVDAADFVEFRPLFGALMAGALRANFTRRLTGVDLTAVVAQARALLSAGPHTRAQLAKGLAVHWPDADPMALAYAATYLVPVVQVPPRGIWGKSAQATWLTADAWLAPRLDDQPSGEPPADGRSGDDAPLSGGAAIERLVVRYLAAFGPASVADAQTWSGLARLREVTDRLDLRTYHGPDGAELLDLPDVALPDEDVPAPPRFLPEYDNLLLSYADRGRVIPHDHPVPLWPGNGGTQGTLLIDGSWDATWKITQEALTITPFRHLTAAEKSEITEEAARLLAFAAPPTTAPAADRPDIRFSAE
jgi:Winged helix DNA-binding domain